MEEARTPTFAPVEPAASHAGEPAAALPRRTVRVRRQKAQHRPQVLPLAPNPGATCRICWGEADGDNGGHLLTPCQCRGTSKFVHVRCLQAWMHQVAQRKGVGYAVKCDVCRARYRLPPDLVMREPFQQRIERHARALWRQALQSPAGPAVQALVGSAWVYSMLSTCYGALLGVTEMPQLLAAARSDPRALFPLLPRFLTSALAEPLLFSRDWCFHVETVAFYAAGWLLDAAARLVEAGVVAALPPHLRAVAEAALWIPKGVGLAFQALDLGLMCAFGGGAAGFAQGGLGVVAAPVRCLALVARGGAAAFGFLAVLLARGGSGAARAANALAQVSLHGRRAPRLPSR